MFNSPCEFDDVDDWRLADSVKFKLEIRSYDCFSANSYLINFKYSLAMFERFSSKEMLVLGRILRCPKVLAATKRRCDNIFTSSQYNNTSHVAEYFQSLQ